MTVSSEVLIKRGDLLKSTERMIVHGCNARGVMGAGIAAPIRKRWPKAYDEYRARFETKGLVLGDVIFVEVSHGKFIANAVTQEDFGRDKLRRYVSYDAIADCMNKVSEYAANAGIPAVAMPRIGAGLANGNWDIILRIIECEFAESGVSAVIYER